MTDWDREEAEQRIAELKAECDTLRRRVLDGDDYREVQRLRERVEALESDLEWEQARYACAANAVRMMAAALKDGNVERASEIAYAWRKS